MRRMVLALVLALALGAAITAGCPRFQTAPVRISVDQRGTLALP